MFYSSTPKAIDTSNLGGQIITDLDVGWSTNLLLTEPELPGDFNQDGSVGAADYVVWRKTDGRSHHQLAIRVVFGRRVDSCDS